MNLLLLDEIKLNLLNEKKLIENNKNYTKKAYNNKLLGNLNDQTNNIINDNFK